MPFDLRKRCGTCKFKITENLLLDIQLSGARMIKTVGPKTIFFIAAPVANLDGTIDAPDADGTSSYLSEQEAVERATTDVEGHGGAVVVYRCVPVARVSAYRAKVERIQLEE